MTHKNCATCKWFEPLHGRTVRWPDSSYGGGQVGACLRFPPSFIDPHKLHACWPSVSAKDRCGEWTPLTSQPEEAKPQKEERARSEDDPALKRVEAASELFCAVRGEVINEDAWQLQEYLRALILRRGRFLKSWEPGFPWKHSRFGSRDAVKMDPQANNKSGHIDEKDRAAAEFLSQAHGALSNVAVCDAEAYQEAMSWLASGAWNPTIRSIGELAGALGYRPELILHKVKPAER